MKRLCPTDKSPLTSLKWKEGKELSQLTFDCNWLGCWCWLVLDPKIFMFLFQKHSLVWHAREGYPLVLWQMTLNDTEKWHCTSSISCKIYYDSFGKGCISSSDMQHLTFTTPVGEKLPVFALPHHFKSKILLKKTNKTDVCFTNYFASIAE